MRYLMAWLWRWLWWRRLLTVLAGSSRTPACVVNWIWIETPYGIALRDLFLRQGWHDMAAEASRVLRERGVG